MSISTSRSMSLLSSIVPFVILPKANNDFTLFILILLLFLQERTTSMNAIILKSCEWWNILIGIIISHLISWTATWMKFLQYIGVCFWFKLFFCPQLWCKEQDEDNNYYLYIGAKRIYNKQTSAKQSNQSSTQNKTLYHSKGNLISPPLAVPLYGEKYTLNHKS